jgi:hypothetical protein
VPASERVRLDHHRPRVGLPLADALALGRAYALRAAAEIVRDESPAD